MTAKGKAVTSEHLDCSDNAHKGAESVEKDHAKNSDIACAGEHLVASNDEVTAKKQVSVKKSKKDVSENYETESFESDLSIADISRKNARPKRWVVYLIVLLMAIVLPYWAGRTLALRSTSSVIDCCSHFSSQGIVFISWMVTVLVFTSIAMALIESSKWFWRLLLLVFLSFEQFIAGLCLLNMNFWYGTYVMYGSASGQANAANLGIISAGSGVIIYSVLFVGLLVLIPKRSRLNVLTKSWASFIMFFFIEVMSLIVVLFGGFITAM